MSVKLQILLIVLILIAMMYIINLVRKKIIDFRYALLWLLVALCVLVLTIFPRLLILLSGALGITSAVNMLFFLGFCLSIVVIFSLSMAVSNLQDKVKRRLPLSGRICTILIRSWKRKSKKKNNEVP